ncbi:hypothetical protein [Ancylomarina sp. 16SWW S1-10-2]|uniref:tetratricopeptide repeat protein n=1 Tax=Ancylomarina sp. 16SWW S1-10-2 TaxID=2499681 RepID=UPI0012AEAD49|nr:hypothetical protein [Ancylomarina sp. 16SWW S1-10-2]MRT93871.1 hypothetical protein [Ancylomarina sp. 16SWW S1-10-2]
MKKTLCLLIVLSCLQFTLIAQNTELLELWQKKDWNELIRTSNAKIQADKSNYQAYYWKQYALLEQGKNKEAIEVLKAAFESCENKIEVRRELENIYFEQGMYLQAKSLLDSLIAHPKPEYRSFEHRILIHEFEKEPQAALELLRKGWGYNPSMSFYWIHLGDNHKIIGEFNSAIQNYESALALNPSDYQTSSKLARLYLMDNPKAALEICQYVLDKDSTNVRFIQIAASAYVKLENEKAALKQYEKAMFLGDSTLNTIRNAGILFQKFKKSDKALDLLNKAYQIDSTNVKVVFYLAMAETYLFNPDRGLELFDESLKLMQADSSILSMIYKEKGIIYGDKKMHQKALNNYLLAYQLNPKKKFFLYLIAEQYDALNKKQEALKYYQLVIDGIDEKRGVDILTASIRDYSKSRIDKLKEDLFMER